MVSADSKRIWNEYADKGDWPLLAKDTERLAEIGSNPEAKIYWVFAQFRLNNLPKKLLFTPLIEAYVKTDDAESRKIALKIADEIVKSGTVSLSEDEKNLLLKLGDAPAVKEAKVEKTTQETKSSPSSSFGLLNPKSHDTSSQKSNQPETTKPRSSVEALSFIKEVKASGTGRNTFLVACIVCCLIVMVGAVGYLVYPFVRNAIAGEGVAFSLFDKSSFISPATDANQTPIVLDSVSKKITKTSELDDLYYYGVGAKKQVALQNVAAQNITVQGGGLRASNETQPAVQPLTPPQLPIRQNVSRVVIDTTGPLEPALPERVKKDALTSGSGSDSYDPLFGNGSPRDWPRNTPPSKGELTRPGEGSRIPHSWGDPDPIEVEKFSSPRVFSVRYRTPIRSKPSSTGTVDAMIYPGDRVLCDARFGNWLRIRSKSGNVGFVYGQDLRAE